MIGQVKKELEYLCRPGSNQGEPLRLFREWGRRCRPRAGVRRVQGAVKAANGQLKVRRRHGGASSVAGATVRVIDQHSRLVTHYCAAPAGVYAVVVVVFCGLTCSWVVSACRGHVLSPSGLEWHQQTEDQQPTKTHGGSLVAVQ